MTCSTVQGPLQSSTSRITIFRLILLSAVAFIFVAFEHFPLDLITVISSDLQIPTSKIGLLISSYSIVAAVVTIPSILIVERFSRKNSITICMLIVVFAEFLTAVALNYPIIALARIIGALTHGIIWSLLAPAAAFLVPKDKISMATSFIFTGASLSIIIGEPINTYLGHTINWRLTSIALAIVTVVIAIAVWIFFPSDDHHFSSAPPKKDHHLRDTAIIMPPSSLPQENTLSTYQTTSNGVTCTDQNADPTNNEVDPAQWKKIMILCAIVSAFFIAHFTVYAFFITIVERITNNPHADLPFLSLFGVSGAIAAILIGKFADHYPVYTVLATGAIFIIAMALLSSIFNLPLAPQPYFILILVISLWGASYGAIGPCIQSAVLKYAGHYTDKASSIYVTSTLCGMAIGSTLGARFIDQHIKEVPIIALMLGIIVFLTIWCFRKIFINTTI